MRLRFEVSDPIVANGRQRTGYMTGHSVGHRFALACQRLAAPALSTADAVENVTARG
jgi:malonyl CoA-acyl carrier protein transacylase